MECLSPINASYSKTGDITFSSTNMMPGLIPFAFPCRKCLPCRLNIAREKAIRATHEAKMHEDNIFLTLTYNEQSLKSPKLQYRDFQLFMKSLREKINRNLYSKEERDEKYIPSMVTGEYGELNKRPHWHAILFNYNPGDGKHHYTTDHGEHVYTSQTLHDTWGRGNIEYGSVTLDSAGYVARYAAKKLVHGQDQEHDYHPIHRTSCRRAIGRSWIEKYYKHTFDNGFVILPNGEKAGIPRYYKDWMKETHPLEYREYLITVKEKQVDLAEAKKRKQELEYLTEVYNRKHGDPLPITRAKINQTILNSKFKQLQERLKL